MSLHQRQLFLRRRVAALEAGEHGAVVLVNELSRTWWGRLALRLALRRIGKG